MILANSMSKFHRPSLYLAVVMVALSLLALALRPTQSMSAQKGQINIEAMIPNAFADWKEDQSANLQFVDPSVTEKVNKTYLQSLSRTFVNSNGQRIMLAIAYGGDQNDMMQVHKPEICYTAQGFHIEQSHDASFNTAYGNFTVREMLAVKGSRLEPVTYWVTIGDKVAVNPLQWRLERIKYGLTGVVPDGLLFRVSSFGQNTEAEYKLQQEFVNALMASISPESRSKLLGVNGVSY